MSTFKYRLANPLTPTIDYKNVSETGCNGNFIPSNAPYINKQRTENPIGVKQPSGPPMQFSHEANLGVNIPPKACDYHILTRLTKDSQLYIDKFWNTRNVAIFDKINFLILKMDEAEPNTALKVQANQEKCLDNKNLA